MFYNKARYFIWFLFLALSIDHEISKFYSKNEDFQRFKRVSENWNYRGSACNGDKIGFRTNLKAVNPLNPSEKVPVFFANFVLMDYGFGAVFGCPAHDQRDFDFATKYNLNIKTVVRPEDENERYTVKDKAYTGSGVIINSEFLNGLKVPDVSVSKTIDILEKKELEKNSSILD